MTMMDAFLLCCCWRHVGHYDFDDIQNKSSGIGSTAARDGGMRNNYSLYHSC
jgi:hypothetical protein